MTYGELLDRFDKYWLWKGDPSPLAYQECIDAAHSVLREMGFSFTRKVARDIVSAKWCFDPSYPLDQEVRDNEQA